MKKNSNRSHSIFSLKVKFDPKINLLREKLNNKNEFNNKKRISETKYDKIDLNNYNKRASVSSKRMTSQLNNLVRMEHFSEKRIQKYQMEEKYEENIRNLAELLTSKNTKNDWREETVLLFLLKNDPKKARVSETDTNKLIEIIKYILSKKEKNERDILIIKEYFSRIDKISTLFSSINSDNIFIKLLSQLNFEEFEEDNIICKEGDRGEKLYITLKGSANVLVQKEGKDGMCTQFEYIKYLIILYLYQEFGMLSKVLFYNKSEIKLKESCILTLFMVFRFYKFYKDLDYFLIDSGIKYEEDSICDFINNQINIKEFIYKKLDFPVEDSVHIFNYTQNIIKELYRFYERKIDQINELNKISKIKRDKIQNHNPLVHPFNYEELYLYGENIKIKYKLKNNKYKKSIKEDIFNRIFEIKEISKDIIYKSTSKDYIQRLNFNSILQDIRNDYTLKADKTLKLKEDQKNIKYFNYIPVNTISQYQMFGELALNSINKKRTATVITNEKCYLGVLLKKIYDSHLKVSQIKSRIRNILYFTEGPIFKGISPNTFLNEFYFSLNKKNIPKGKSLFNKGDKRNKIFFIEKGEFELGYKLTLKKMGEIMNNLGGISDDKKEKYLCNVFLEFKNIYENKNMNIKICILDKSYIIGLDDMCLDNRYLFDCKCVSTDGADIYELNYTKYEKALNEYNIILKNNVEYVNNKKEYLIKILFEQRNSLVEFEYLKLKEENFRKEKIKEINHSKKFNILGTLMKDVKYNTNKLNNIAHYKNNKTRNINKSRGENNNTISNDDKKYIRNSIYKITQMPSMKNLYNDDKHMSIANEYDGNSSRIKSLNNFYPRIESEKNINLNSFKSINNFYSDNSKKDIKNRMKLIKLRKNKKYNYDFTDSNIIFNDKNKILESLNIYINDNTSIEKRRKRNIIPIITNYKLSLNKRRLKNIKKIKGGFKIPSLFKEHSKEYSSLKTKIIQDIDTLYSDYQKNVYNIFYPKHSKKMMEIKESEYDIKDKFFTNFTQDSKINKDTSLDKEIQKRKKNNKSTNIAFNKEKNKDINDINYFDLSEVVNNKGVIDCLCFDNWAEKRQFEKNLLKYKIF